ncbi:MAG: PQQ-binding-like beta-propeller repeat protein [Vampirovibrionales bacterium]
MVRAIWVLGLCGVLCFQLALGLLNVAQARPRSNSPIAAMALSQPGLSALTHSTGVFKLPPALAWQQVLPQVRLGSVISVGPYWVTALGDAQWEGVSSSVAATLLTKEKSATRIAAYDWETGERQWVVDLPGGLEAVYLQAVPPLKSDGVSQEPTDMLVTLSEGALIRLSGKTGQPRWLAPVAPQEGLVPAMVMDETGVMVISTMGRLSRLSLATGAVVWQRQLSETPLPEGVLVPPSQNTGQPPVLAEQPLAIGGDVAYPTVVVAESTGTLHAFQAQSGKPIWVQATQQEVRSIQWLSPHWVMATDRGLLTALKPETGVTAWSLVSLDGQPLVTQAMPSGPHWVTASLGGQVLMANPKTGVRSGHEKLPQGVSSGWVPLGDGALVGTLTDGRLIAYEPPKPQTVSSYRPFKRNNTSTVPSPPKPASSIRWEVPLRHRVVEAPLIQPLPSGWWLLAASTDGTVQAYRWSSSPVVP